MMKVTENIMEEDNKFMCEYMTGLKVLLRTRLDLEVGWIALEDMTH